MMFIQLQNITKNYKNPDGKSFIRVLKDINLNIDKGEMLAIKGASGSGKSTFLHIIGCLDRQTTGTYFLNGEDVASFNASQLAIKRNTMFGFVMQNFALIDDDSVLENVAAPLLFSKKHFSSIDTIALKQLQSLKIDHLASKRVAKLSGGERQRVAIARALVNNPEIILADEPTGALDADNKQKIIDLLQMLNKNGKTVLIVTHDDAVALSCKRIINISDGAIL